MCDDYIVLESKEFIITKKINFFNIPLYELFLCNYLKFLEEFFIFNHLKLSKHHKKLFKKNAIRYFKEKKALCNKTIKSKKDQPGEREIIVESFSNCFQIFNYVYKKGTFGKHLHTKKWIKKRKLILTNNEKSVFISQTNRRKEKLLDLKKYFVFHKSYNASKPLQMAFDSDLQNKIFEEIQNKNKKRGSAFDTLNSIKNVKTNVNDFYLGVSNLKEKYGVQNKYELKIPFKYFDELVDSLSSNQFEKEKKK